MSEWYSQTTCRRNASSRCRSAGHSGRSGRAITPLRRVRAIDGIGSELRYEWNGELRASQVFKTWEELEAGSRGEAARARGEEGWAAA